MDGNLNLVVLIKSVLIYRKKSVLPEKSKNLIFELNQIFIE